MILSYLRDLRFFVVEFGGYFSGLREAYSTNVSIAKIAHRCNRVTNRNIYGLSPPMANPK
jgi:hypothetical protein